MNFAVLIKVCYFSFPSAFLMLYSRFKRKKNKKTSIFSGKKKWSTLQQRIQLLEPASLLIRYGNPMYKMRDVALKVFYSAQYLILFS